jgi:hypothetical protein
MYEFAIHAQSGSASGLIAVGSRPAGVGGWEGSRSSDGSQFFSRHPSRHVDAGEAVVFNLLIRGLASVTLHA